MSPKNLKSYFKIAHGLHKKNHEGNYKMLQI